MIRSSDILRAHAVEKRVADHCPYRPLVKLLQQLQNDDEHLNFANPFQLPELGAMPVERNILHQVAFMRALYDQT